MPTPAPPAPNVAGAVPDQIEPYQTPVEMAVAEAGMAIAKTKVTSNAISLTKPSDFKVAARVAAQHDSSIHCFLQDSKLFLHDSLQFSRVGEAVGGEWGHTGRAGLKPRAG